MRSIVEIFRSAAILDSNGRHTNGSDKESNHRYGEAYERILNGRRLKARMIMEVGIADGSSLVAWSEVFPYAQCVGFDIHHSDKAHGERIEFHLGDASSKAACERAAAGRRFDFICEDASHFAADNILTLLYLWPFVRSGGLYVIEEFSNILELRDNIRELFPCAEIVDTVGPTGGIEPLVVMRKPPIYSAYDEVAD